MKKNIFLILILFLAAVLRFYRFDYPALNADEAAIGYNAYSLIQTGKDEHGNPWPIHFQSFNDYKPGGYFYIVLPFVWIFGLNEWSVRFPGALLGVVTVYLIYLLTKEILKNHQSQFAGHCSLAAALLLAISPWHIHFSRGGWEVNVATFFITLGVFLFYKSLKKPSYFVFSVLSFAISLYTYHAARVVIPLIGVALLFFNRRELFFSKNIRRQFFGSLLFGLILVAPLLLSLGSGITRASGVSIFRDTGYIDRINESRGRTGDPNSLSAKLLYNKPKELAKEFAENYRQHFREEFLFLSGDDIQRNKVPGFGQLYLWQFPFLVIAAFAIAKRSKNWGIVLAWLVIAPIPAALTFQSPHALRAQNMVIPLTILSAYGLSVFLEFLKNNVTKKFLLVSCYFLVFAVIAWHFFNYIHKYHVHMAKAYPYSSQYGVKELVLYLHSSSSERVLVTTRYDQPYILFLFYLKYPPKEFQIDHSLTPVDKFGFSTVPSFGKFIFKTINFEEDKIQYPNTLIAGADEEIPDEANIVREIYENDFLYFQVVAN